MKLGRNDLCHCGSGKKFKRCCMSSVSKMLQQAQTCVYLVLNKDRQTHHKVATYEKRRESV